MSKRKNSNRKRIPLRDRVRKSNTTGSSNSTFVETEEMKEQSKKFWYIVIGITILALILLFSTYTKFMS